MDSDEEMNEEAQDVPDILVETPDRSSEPPELPEVKLKTYEYNSFWRMNLVNSPTGALTFSTVCRTELLKWDSIWTVSSDDGVFFKIEHTLYCHPPPDIPKWSITVQMRETLQISDANQHEEEVTPCGLEMRFTVNDEIPQYKFFYHVDEAVAGKLITHERGNLWVAMELGIIKATNLQNIISETIDFKSKFDQSNVVIDLNGEIYHFLYELLFLNSQYFYDFWSSLSHEVTPDGSFFVKLEVDDEHVVIGFIEILKFLFYKTPVRGGNLEHILAAAKMFKFETVMIACEHFLLCDPTTPENKKIYLAYHNDMSELQHQLVGDSPPATIHNITSERFHLPEMRTCYSGQGDFQVSQGGMIQPLGFDATLMFPWRIQVIHDRYIQQVCFAMHPTFCTLNYAALNWSFSADFTFTVNGRATSFSYTLSSGKTKIIARMDIGVVTDQELVPFLIDMDVKSVHGLRYYMEPSSLRQYDIKQPSSTLILETIDRRFFVNGTYLSFFSDFFKGSLSHSELFPLDPTTQLPVMDFRDMDAKSLQMLLNLVYPSKPDMLNDAMIDTVLPFADRYLFTSVLKDIESFLIRGLCEPLLGLRPLQIAIRFNFKCLKMEFLNLLTTPQQIHNLCRDPEYHNVTEDVKVALLDRMMELQWPAQPVRNLYPSLFFNPYNPYL